MSWNVTWRSVIGSVLGLPQGLPIDGESASELAANDSGQVSGVWVDGIVSYSAQQAPEVADTIVRSMTARGYLVEQIRVPTDSELFGAIVACKVGLGGGDYGPPDPDLAAAAMADALSAFTTGNAIASNAGEINDQVIKPTLKQAEKVGEFGGIALGTVAVIAAIAYVVLLTGGVRSGG